MYELANRETIVGNRSPILSKPVHYLRPHSSFFLDLIIGKIEGGNFKVQCLW